VTESNIEFRIASSSTENTWVMRITKDRRIEVNEDVEVTYAAQKVLDAMRNLLLQQQRTWVGLTDDEITEFHIRLTMPKLQIKAIEAKLKEKNA
jgi:hypothetical protein